MIVLTQLNICPMKIHRRRNYSLDKTRELLGVVKYGHSGVLKAYITLLAEY